MAEPIGALRAELSAGHAQFSSDMAKARDAVRDRGKEMETAMMKVKNGFDSAMTTINRFGAMAALAAGTGVAMFIKSAIDGADKMYKMSQAAGVSVESLSTLAYAAKLSDVDVDTLGTSLTRLSKNMSDAAMGSGTAKDAFDAMGLKVTNADGTMKTSADTLRAIADRFQKLEDGAAKTAMAVSIFGRAGAGMIPMLNMGSAGIKQLEERAKELGLQISTETGQAAEKFNDQLAELKANASGLGISVAEKLLPHLNDMVKSMQTAYEESGLLMAAWVALGGVGDAIFMPSNDINKRIEQARKELEAVRNLANQPMSNFSPRNWNTEIKSAEEKLRKLEEIKTTEKASEEARRAAAKADAERKAAATAALEKQISGTKTAKEAEAAKDAAAKKSAEARRNAIFKAHDEEQQGIEDDNIAYAKANDQQTAGDVKYWEESTKLAQEGGLAALQATLDAGNASELAKAEALDADEKRAEDRTQIERDLYSDIRGYESEAYAASMALIESQEKRYRAAGVSEIAIAAWVAEEKIKAKERETLAIGSFADGARLGFKDWMEDAEKAAVQGENVTKKAFDGMADALTNYITTGKADFKSFADSIVADIIRMQIQQEMLFAMSGGAKGSSLLGAVISIAGAVAGGGESADFDGGGGFLASAKGNIFQGGHVMPFASGGVVSGPTIFPMATGAGLMGEAGPEAVMPLTRLPGGDLGVRSGGGGSGGESNVTNIIINATDAKSFEDMCKRNPAAITGPVLQSLRDNKTRTEFKRLVT